MKEAIIHSTRGGAATTARADPPASTSTAPAQVLEDAETLPLHDPPPSSPSTACSPSKRKHAKSTSPHRSQSSASSDESLASGCRSRGSQSSSSSSSGSSSRSGSGSESQSGSPSRSKASAGTQSVHLVAASAGGVEILSWDEASGVKHDVSYSTDKADVSQGSIPLLNISAAADDETRKCKAHDLARRSDTNFTAWKEQQISKGVKGIEEWDNVVNDYTVGKRKPKNPDSLGPPISYIEECGVFQPLASTTNPLGLCRFYHVDSNVSTPKTPKPPATVEHVKKLLLLASTQ